MKNLLLVIVISFLIFACGGGSSHSVIANNGDDITVIDYEDIEIYPINTTGHFEGCAKCSYDRNEQTYSNVYHPVFRSYLKVEFPCDDYGDIKEQEFWVLLHGNGRDVKIRESDGAVLGIINPSGKGWYKFVSTVSDWCQGIWFCCDGGEQIMVYEVYKIVTYKALPA